MKKLVIATRGSALALWQANHIKALLQERHLGLDVELLVLKTRGDVILDVPLAKVGGKGLFVKEIEDALLSGQADLAVHSMKDVPMILPEGLVLGVVPEREVKSDLFLSEHYDGLATLPPGATLGTSSLRRQAQVLAARPDIRVAMLRGNVETRLRKMREGQFDAIILACAGMKRLGLSAPREAVLTAPEFLPAVGQGALGVEMRADRADLHEMMAFLEHVPTRICVEAERGFLAGLDGGCQVPIAANAELKDGRMQLEGLVAEPDGSRILRRSVCGDIREGSDQARKLGEELADELLEAGAREILVRLYGEEHEEARS